MQVRRGARARRRPGSVDGKEVFAYTAAHAIEAARPSVVFLHGAGLDHSWFGLQSRYFGYHGRNVLALDLPGHGLIVALLCMSLTLAISLSYSSSVPR